MPPHSSHILQPLDVSCFGPLKQAYSRQIEDMMRAHITHITKDDFFPAFLRAFYASITEKNIRAGFQCTGIVPFDPETVISRLDIKLKTPTPPSSRPGTALPWVSKTPNNPIEATSQSEFIKTRIAQHQNSSPTSIYTAVDQITRGAQGMMHTVALLKAEVTALQQANEILSKRRRVKKTRLRQGGTLSLQDSRDLEDQINVSEQVKQEMQSSSGRKPRTEIHARRCGICGETGHNARTCEKDIEEIEEDDSE